MADFGIRRGLAQSFNYDQRVADIARQNDQMRQAKLYAENQAKMQAEDFDYNNAMNAWDNTQVKEFAQGKIKELGAFIRDNPDYKYNLEKRIVYNNIKKELKDNKPLLEGMQVDANVKAMQAYMNDPKNAPLVQSEEFSPIKAQYENYLKTGSTDGNLANRKLFTFTPPEELVDTTPLLSKYASLTGQNGKDTKWLANGVGSVHQFVSDMDKAAAAEGAINDKVLGRHLQREYNDYASKLGEGQKPLTLKQYTVEKMKPYFKGDEYKTFNYATGAKKNNGADATDKTPNRNPYLEIINHAKAQGKGTPVNLDPAGANQMLTGGKNILNTSGMYFESSPGNFIPFKGGNQIDYTTSGSTVRWDPNLNKAIATVRVQVPVKEVESYIGGADAIDFASWGTKWTGNKNEVRKGWEDKIQLVTDTDGTEKASILLQVPLDEINSSMALGYNHGAGGRAEGVTSEITQPNTWTANGVDWEVRSDGNAYGSNGEVWSPEGKRLK